MEKLRSKDGTLIAVDSFGTGPPVMLIGGALSNRSAAAPLAELLASDFRVFTVDRRGRGDSTDREPYAVEREVEDIAAVVSYVGGSARLFGHSSGGGLALEAANTVAGIRSIALYEPPFIVDAARPALPAGYEETLRGLLAGGDRSAALEHFLTVAVQVPREMVAGMKESPMWQGMTAVAHTLLYDQALVGRYMKGTAIPKETWSAVTMPALVLTGGASPPWFASTGAALAGLLADARHEVVPGQGHGFDPAVVAPYLRAHFLAH